MFHWSSGKSRKSNPKLNFAASEAAQSPTIAERYPACFRICGSDATDEPCLLGRHEGVAHAVAMRPGAAEQGDQARRGARARNVAIGELRGALGETRKIGRELAAIAPSEEAVGAQRVGADQDDVGRRNAMVREQRTAAGSRAAVAHQQIAT